jgi:hypothetical protein
MPQFARYTVFGQHFARFGPDVFRLDRHPSMVRHPTTPPTRPTSAPCSPARGARSSTSWRAGLTGGSSAPSFAKLPAARQLVAQHLVIWR